MPPPLPPPGVIESRYGQLARVTEAVAADRIDGEWSDPVYLNSSGFDPSLFHDDGGKKYLVNMLWDHRPGKNRSWCSPQHSGARRRRRR